MQDARRKASRALVDQAEAAEDSRPGAGGGAGGSFGGGAAGGGSGAGGAGGVLLRMGTDFVNKYISMLGEAAQHSTLLGEAAQHISC